MEIKYYKVVKMDISYVLLVAFIAGAVTLIGGIIPRFYKISKRLSQFLIILASGIVLSVSLIGLLPMSFTLGGSSFTALGFFLGGIALIITGKLFPHTYGDEKFEDKLYSILKTTSLVVTGSVLHNITLGLLIGAGFAISVMLGVGVTIALVFHNIIRGISINNPLRQTGLETKKIYLLMFISGIPALIGALPAYYIISSAVAPLSSIGIAFACGALLFILLDQISPIMKSYSNRHEIAASLFLGIFFGILLLGIG